MDSLSFIRKAWVAGVGVFLLACAGPLAAADGVAKGSVTYKAKSGPITVSPKFAYLVKGPDAADNTVIVRHLILSATDIGARIRACQTLSCSDSDLGDGMTVDFDVGPRLNYWVVMNGQRVQYSGTVKPDAFRATANTPTRLAGKLVFDGSAAGGAAVDIEFDAALLTEFRKGH